MILRCPTAFGALVAKAAAATEIVGESSERRLRHQLDIVVLAAVLAVDGIAELDITRTDRRRIAKAALPLLTNPSHEAWDIDRSEDAKTVLRRLAGLDSAGP